VKTVELNCNKPTLPIARSSAGIDITCPQYWRITHGSSWPGGYVLL